MKATMLDLRRKMKQVVNALEHNEKVTIFYRGKEKGIIYPAGKKGKNIISVSEHPAFGMWKGRKGSVKDEIDKLRKGRY
ncbi:MAG: type II toxin-antitoxin system Phd/YefM family antitoxin [Candidatus Goldiibacteriota bacterium]